MSSGDNGSRESRSTRNIVAVFEENRDQATRISEKKVASAENRPAKKANFIRKYAPDYLAFGKKRCYWAFCGGTTNTSLLHKKLVSRPQLICAVILRVAYASKRFSIFLISPLMRGITSVLKRSPAMTIEGVFDDMKTSSINDASNAFVLFLCKKLQGLSLEVDVQEIILRKSAEVCTRINDGAFIGLIQFVSGFKFAQTPACKQSVLKMIAEKLDIPGNPPFTTGYSCRLSTIMPLAKPFFSPSTPSQQYVAYVIESFLPELNVERPKDLEILTLLRDMSEQYGEPKEEIAKRQTESALQRLLACIENLIPAVPSEWNQKGGADLTRCPLAHLRELFETFTTIAQKARPTFVDNEEFLQSKLQKLRYLKQGLESESRELERLVCHGKNVNQEKRTKKRLLSQLVNLVDLWFRNPPSFEPSRGSQIVVDEAPVSDHDYFVRRSFLISYIPNYFIDAL
ncbi:uncharacterized protein LOC100906177 [Galendromus occidentalis]|uniref:Uncharacterized protein LOC100906177 n=1 Tax=Galendromus occidentalis TaxID=34638 RepID=A0AAJ6QYG5_9ACAR|nr:uncharacterized protein LOC100906177 [Galendromus occidentalis]